MRGCCCRGRSPSSPEPGRASAGPARCGSPPRGRRSSPPTSAARKADETVELIEREGGTAAPARRTWPSAPTSSGWSPSPSRRSAASTRCSTTPARSAPAPPSTCPVEDWDLVMAVNVRSVFLGAKYAVPVMAAGGGGTIVSTASVSGMGGDPASVVYSASKAAVINLTRSLAVDHARQNIRVNCICPGAIDTPPVGRMLERPRGPPAQRAGPSARPHRPAGGDRRRRGVAVVGGVVVRHRPGAGRRRRADRAVAPHGHGRSAARPPAPGVALTRPAPRPLTAARWPRSNRCPEMANIHPAPHPTSSTTDPSAS